MLPWVLCNLCGAGYSLGTAGASALLPLIFKMNLLRYAVEYEQKGQSAYSAVSDSCELKIKRQTAPSN